MLLRTARKVVVGVIGGTVALVGAIMVVTPGPALVVIPLGLAILATEFVWARRLLNRVKARARNMLGRTPAGSDRQKPDRPAH